MKRISCSLLILLLLLVMAACSNTASTNNGGPENESSQQSTVNGATGESGMEEGSGGEQGTRVVQHSKGEKEIPANPQRIAVINVVAFEDNLLALGVKPYIAPVFTWSEQGFLPYLADELAGVHGVDGAEPNLEQLLELQPDLILIEERHAEAYEQFEMIAPTVIVSSDPDWRVRLKHLADIVNKAQEAEVLLQDYDNNVAAEKLEIEASRSGETVILANMQDLRKIRVQGMVGHAVNELLYDELALTPASGVPSDEMRLEISLEGFIGMDPDHIFLQKNRNQTAEELMTSLGTDPLISNLKAFQNGHIYIVDDMLTKSWGIQGRSSLVEVIEEALTQ